MRGDTSARAVESAGAGGAAIPLPFDVSGPPPLPAAAAGRGAQQPQQRSLQLQRRFTNGLQRRLVATGDAPAEGEAALTETVSQRRLRLQRELDDLLEDVPAYRHLLRQKELDRIAERYADEEERDPSEFSILGRARSHLRDLHRRKGIWVALSRSLMVAFVLALFVLSSLTSPVGPRGTPLDYAERRTRRNEFCVVAALALGILMVALYGEWRKRALNNQIYLQELQTDRIAFEAVAGLRPTEKNVLGPSKKDIEQHKRALKKKAMERERRKYERTY